MSIESIVAIQKALVRNKCSPGAIDGIWGRRTVAAVKAFQRSRGLQVDGIVGPQTLAALGSGEAALPATVPLPWLAEAVNLIGTKEVLGDRDSPVILDWADNLDLHYPGDETPWCGLFVAHCVAATLTDETLPTNPLGARQWARFGKATDPRLGAIMVFWRDGKASGKGHVGFYAGEDKGAYRILGGNQQNAVCFTWIARDRFLEARWPETAMALAGGASKLMVDRNAKPGTDLAATVALEQLATDKGLA